MIATCGVWNLGWICAQALGQLAVLAHREGEPRDADQPGVGGDQQDHRGEDADVDAQDVGEPGAEAEVLDDPEHRVVRRTWSPARSCSRRAVGVTGIADSATIGSSA